MAATVAVLGTSVFNTTAGNKTITATPTVGDLIIIITAATGVATTIADNGTGGTYTQVDSTRTGFSTTGNLQMWVRNNLVSSATSTTYTATQTSSTGGGLVILRVTGMSVAGASAIRSSGGQSTGTAATTPAPVLSSTPLSSNPVIMAVANGTNSTTTLTPRTGYTEDFDNGYSTPATGLEVSHRASGETSATLTAGSTTATAFASIAVELQYNTAPTTALTLPLDTYKEPSTTPQLVFAGTDADSDAVTYEVQVDTVNTFDSQGIIDSYSETNSNTSTSLGATTWSAFSKLAQGFTGNGATLDSAKFYVSKTGAPTGNATVSLYAITGSYGSSAVPTGAALATSDVFDVTTISTSLALISFTFSGANRITLTNGTNYAVSIEYSGGTASDGLNVGRDSTSPTHSGNTASFTTSGATWSASSLNDFPFYVLSVVTPLIDKLSNTDPGFVDITNGSDPDPFNSGDQIGFYPNATATTYYFDGHVSTTNNGTAWTNPANAFDGSTSTSAGRSGSASLATSYLEGVGTNAPSSGGTIVMVQARLWGVDLDTAVRANIFTNGRAESLGVATGAASYGSYVTLATPAVGWDWSTLQNLDVVFTRATGVSSATVFRTEILVTTATGLTNGTTYYWRARSKDTAGTNTYGAWATTRSFQVDTTAPSVSTDISTGFSGTVTRTWYHTVYGPNPLLILTADLWQDVAGTGTVTAVSFNSVALTQIGTGITNGAMRSEMWYLKAPPTGTYLMSVTVTNATDARKFSAASFSGYDQTSPLDASNTATASTGNPSASVTTLTANALVVATLSRFSTTAATTNRTRIFNDAVTSVLGAASYQLATTTGSYSDTYTGSAAQDWSMTIASFKPVASGTVLTKTQSAVARIAVTRTFTQPATARIQISSTKTQSVIARISTALTKTQNAIARVAKQLTTTQPAISRISKTGLTKTQSALARISKSLTFTQPAIARISKAFTFTQPAKARIAVAITKTQSAIARITNTATKTQSAVARISKSFTFTQSAAARIAKGFTFTQSAAARIAISATKTQTATARLINTVIKTQTAVARISKALTTTQVANGRIAKGFTATQSAIARVQKAFTKTQTSVARIAINATKTQSATARITNAVIKTQGALARITNAQAKTQAAVARIQKLFSLTQPATARISKALTKTQTAVANITVAGISSKTQSAIARITNTASVTQTAVARIQKIVTKTQVATARIAVGFTKTQSAIARISSAVTKTQTAAARISKQLTKTQQALARIATTVTKTQNATARVQKGFTFTQSAIARIAKALTKTQSATARISTQQSKTQPAVSRISISSAKTQPANARITKQLTFTQAAKARIQRLFSLTQTAIARIQRSNTLTQTAGAFIVLPVQSNPGAAVTLSQMPFSASLSSQNYNSVPTTDNGQQTLSSDAQEAHSLSSVNNMVIL